MGILRFYLIAEKPNRYFSLKNGKYVPKHEYIYCILNFYLDISKFRVFNVNNFL